MTNRPERTDLFGSLMYAIDIFHTSEFGDAIYLISDGGDNHSKHQEKDVERILLSKGIRLFCLKLSNRFMTTPEEAEDAIAIERLAEATGGSIANAWSDHSGSGGRLNAPLRNFSELLIAFYELKVDLPAKFETKRRLEVWAVDENGKRRKDVQITHPRNFFIDCQ